MSEGGVDDNHRRRLTKKSCWDCAKRQVEIMRRAKRKPSRIKLCSRMVNLNSWIMSVGNQLLNFISLQQFLCRDEK